MVQTTALTTLATPGLPQSFTAKAEAAVNAVPKLAMNQYRRRRSHMQFLKYNTASQVTAVGPFVDKTDGVTGQTTAVSTSSEIHKNGGTSATGPVLGTHLGEGWYPVTFDATMTNTLGRLVYKAHDSADHLPVWHEYMVLPANVYDSLVGGSDNLDVEVASMAANVLTATAINADAITEAKIADNAIATEHIATAAITADSLGADAITAAKVANDVHLECADTVWDETMAGHLTADTAGAHMRATTLVSTTISGAPTSQVQFILAAGSTDADAYNGATIIVTDASTSTQRCVGLISDYIVTTREVFLDADPGVFTMASGDRVEIIPASPIHQLTNTVVDAVLSDTGTDGVVVASINASAITAASIATDAITAAKIEADAIGSSELATGAITTAQFAAGAINAAAIGADAITEAKIADNAIAAEHIATAAIVAATFGAGAIDAAAIAADAATEIADSLLDQANGIESSVTVRQAIQLIAAASCGLLSDAATTTITIKGVQNGASGAGTTRISATVDADGNRSSMTTSPT